MRREIIASCLLGILLLSPCGSVQQSAAAQQTPPVLQGALTALTGGTAVADVTLAGTARRIAGSDNETGTATQSVSQVPQPLALLQQAVAALGGSAPSDSTANGTITTVAGTQTENGTLVVLTRGTGQTSEQIGTRSGSTEVYSQGQASLIVGANLTALPLERAVTSQCPDFPLPLLAGALNNPDTAYKYVGLETLNSVSAHHIQFWNSFTSTAKLQSLANFSVRDIWIDPVSGLPQKLSYTRRDAGGAAPGITVDVFLSNYQNLGGVLYPFSIQKRLNGTPWATITIQSVTFNTGLTDADFPVR